MINAEIENTIEMISDGFSDAPAFGSWNPQKRAQRMFDSALSIDSAGENSPTVFVLAILMICGIYPNDVHAPAAVTRNIESHEFAW